MTHSWPRAVFTFALSAAASAAVLRVSWGHVDALTPWAREPQVAWSLAAFAGLVAAVGVAIRSYLQLRNPRLYALAFLLLVPGALHLVRFVNPISQLQGAQSAAVTGSAPAAGDAFAEEAVPVRFYGLPDSVAKQHPALAAQLIRLADRLYGFSFLLVPIAVVLASLAGKAASRPRLRLVTLLGVALEVAALGALARWGPPTLGAWDHAQAAVAGTTGLAVAAALLAWRSPAGLPGAVAGLTVFLLPAALANAGVDPADLGLNVKTLPLGCERALVLTFPALVLGLIAHEWVVGMSHSTQTDALTQIFNKAYAEAIVTQTGGAELGSRFAVALLDIDHFKQVNDTYGHGAGDVVLQEVCKSISRTIQSRGLVCRTGGEEITVFFPGADVDAAAAIGDEVRRGVEALRIDAHTNAGKRETLEVTISVGVACNLSPDGAVIYQRTRDVVEAADRALYAAKDGGRNRVARDGA